MQSKMCKIIPISLCVEKSRVSGKMEENMPISFKIVSWSLLKWNTSKTTLQAKILCSRLNTHTSCKQDCYYCYDDADDLMCAICTLFFIFIMCSVCKHIYEMNQCCEKHVQAMICILFKRNMSKISFIPEIHHYLHHFRPSHLTNSSNEYFSHKSLMLWK